MKKVFRKQAKQLVVLAIEDKIRQKVMHQGVTCHDIDFIVTNKRLEERDLTKLAKYHETCLSETVGVKGSSVKALRCVLFGHTNDVVKKVAPIISPLYNIT